LYRLKTADMI